MNMYLINKLEPGDHYCNHYRHATLPCDRLLDKPYELAEMSGPVRTYNLRDSEREVKKG